MVKGRVWARAGPQARTKDARRTRPDRKMMTVRRPRREGLPTRCRSDRQSQMHIPSRAAHTVIRVIDVIFDMRTSFFARYDSGIVTNSAVEFQVLRTENFRIASDGPPFLRRGHSTHDGRTTAGQHSVPGLYCPVSPGGCP